MKTTLVVLLSGLLLCGCSQKQEESTGPAIDTSSSPAIDLVQVGKDLGWKGGLVLHIGKRDGTTVEGIQIVDNSSGGKMTTITADTGTLSPGSIEDAADVNSVRLTLHNAHSVTLAPTGAKTVIEMKEMILVLKK